MGPLEGIRVLDLSRVLAGPTATQMMADFGAEVIKIERPRTGDDTRQWGPPYVKDTDGNDSDLATYFVSANRGKRSVAIDIARPEGQALVRRLAERSDVFFENFKTHGLRQYGLDHETIRALNPRIVYASITGFGQTGPYAPRPGYDPIAQAMGGLMSVTGIPDGEPGGGPQRAGVAVTDVMTGVYAVAAVLAGLIHRGASGNGQFIDLSLLDVQIAGMTNVAQAYLGAGVVGERCNSVHPSVVPSQIFRCLEGSVMLVAGNDAQFGALCLVLGRPEWARDERFAINASRVRHRDVLIPALQDRLMTRTAAEWTIACSDVGVPCGPINDIAQAFADPQVMARGMRIELPHSSLGRLALVGCPVQFSDTPVEYRRPPPGLGEHTEEVLREVLGMQKAELDDLRGAAIVG